MKRSLLALIPAVALMALLSACGGKQESGPVAAKNFAQYTDDFLKFSVRYPSDWKAGVSAGSQAVFYSNPASGDGFIRYEPKGQKGAKIDVQAIKGGQEEMNKSIADLKYPFTDPKVFKDPEQVTLNGMPATKLSYSFDVDDTKFTAERYYVVKDSVVTYIETAVIGNYGDYAAIFDSARASFKPGLMMAAAPRVVDTTGGTKTMRDSDLVEPPATTMKSYSNQYFSVEYPSNFNPGTSRAGGALASTNFAGARNDSYFQVDVIDAKGIELNTIVDQNKKNYGGKAPAAAQVGGEKAFVFNYGNKDVGSKAYFLIGNGRLYRITVNWFRPQQDTYLPAFDKAVGSFKAK